jgi:hypothetical protein
MVVFQPNENSLQPTAQFTANGEYILRFTVDNGHLSAHKDVALTVNRSPIVDAGADQTITLPAVAELDGTVGDDGLPSDPGRVRMQWSKVSGPGEVTFTNPTENYTQASFSAPGSYALRLTADDGAVSVSDEVAIVAKAPPREIRELLALHFDEDEGTIAHDTSGNDFDGTLIGTTTWVSGKVGKALQFNGTDSAVRIPPLEITTDTLTFMAWVRGIPTGSWSGILYSRHATQPIGMHYYSDTRQLAYTWNNNDPATYSCSDGPEIPANEWALVAVTIEPTKAVLYVVSRSAGMQVGTNDIPHQPQSLDTEFFLAYDALDDENRRFSGILDNVRIFQGALTAEHIQAIYDAER